MTYASSQDPEIMRSISASAAVGDPLREYSIAVVPGDGIGGEVILAAQQVLDAACELNGGLILRYCNHFVGFEHYQKTGDVLPYSVLKSLQTADAVLVGAMDVAAFPSGVGDPLEGLRKGLDVSASIRRSKSYRGVEIPALPIDVLVVREVTEGLYSGVEYAAGQDAASAVRIITREATTRAAKIAFDQAMMRKKKVTAVHKLGALKISDRLFLDAVETIAKDYPNVAYETRNVDACAMELIQKPDDYDVILASNSFGDILSDVAAALAGGLGLAPSGCIGPDYAYFEPVHGSAPDIAGAGIANPIAAILSAALMLRYLGESAVADLIDSAVSMTLAAGEIRTGDLGGAASCAEMTSAVIHAIRQVNHG